MRRAPSASYLSKQTDINEKMRAILVDWLVEVHLKFKLMPETLYLTVNIIDRFLELKIVARQKLQLLGVTAMLIASKYEEIYPPEVRDFVYITDKAYSRNEILKMESLVLNVLRFNLTVPSPLVFLIRYLKAANASKETKQLASYVCERMQQEYSMLKYLPSTIAASAVWVALNSQRKAWSANIQAHSGYTEATMRPCIDDVEARFKSGEKSSLQAVRKKYASAKFLEVSKTRLSFH